MGDDLKGVERVVVVGGMHAGIQNAEAALVKITANPGKQVSLVGRVDQHLQAFTQGRHARPHNGFARIDMPRKLPCVPGNVVGIVVHEVAHIHRVPQRFVGFKRQGMQSQLNQRFTFAGFNFDMWVSHMAAQHAQRQAVQVFQQFAFPSVPHLWAGAADVGHGEQVQGCQMPLIAHAFGECGNHVRVAQVGFLGHMAHGQVLTHHKLNQVRVFVRHVVLFAKVPRIFGTQHRVVAATALGNVMKQGSHVQNPGLVPTRGQLRTERVLMGVLGNKEAPHIAQHHQHMLVHGVHMEQVVLHLADNFAERPQVAPEHRGLVHQPHGVGDATALHQNLHEGVAVNRVVAELAIHQATRVVQGTQGTC